MNARINALKRTGAALVVLVCLTAALLALSSPALAVKRGTESVNCGGAASQSASFKAHDTIAQCPIGPVGEGGGMRIYDGFWLTLPNINVPVEGAVFAVLSEEGTPLIRWTVGSLAGLTGFNIYRATAEDGTYELMNDEPLLAESPGSYEDTTTWPETTFWYEVRTVDAGGTEDIVTGSPARVTTEGRLALRLYPLRPNPMSGSTSVSFDIPDHSGPVHLVIYNVRGQRVCAVVDGPIDRGRHERSWDGTDDTGRPVSSGVYFARLEVDGKSNDQKVMVLR
ncbi:MAG: FlgD immunoglobulin-like domain containing protein [Candidatus Eisenbacteria bacterium]|nr:FlgD immunoglobulin-like domain containing protein [Candidatus Eisenbacteria bacterium]